MILDRFKEYISKKLTRAFSKRALNVTKRIVAKEENNGVSTKTMPLKRQQSISIYQRKSATRRSTRNKNRSVSYTYDSDEYEEE